MKNKNQKAKKHRSVGQAQKSHFNRSTLHPGSELRIQDGPFDKAQARLRSRAEVLLTEKAENLDELSKAETRSLVHELRVHQIELEMQNEELRRAQIELEDSRSRYFDLYDFAPMGYFTLDKDCLIQEVNLTGTALLRVERKYLIKRLFSIYIPGEDRNSFYTYKRKLIKTPTRQTCELRMRRKDGTVFYAQLEGIAVFDSEDNVSHLRVAMHDITERRRAEEQIRASLEEKETLLKEIHHRVKNNLQIISSLLNLQSKSIKDKQAREKFKESQNRIRSMALVHEKLYQSKNLVRIDSEEYVKSLSTYLFHSYATGSNIKLNTDIDNVLLNIDKAIPCGLIINELISNSLRHAFPSKSIEGEISVTLRSHGQPHVAARERKAGSGDKLTLIVSNNGVPFPEDVDFRNTESLGLRLVCILVEQLKGNIQLDRNGRTEFKVVFPVY